MARFSGVPEIPEGLGQDWAPVLLGAMKQNIELLCGIRGEPDSASQALLRGDSDILLRTQEDVFLRGQLQIREAPPISGFSYQLSYSPYTTNYSPYTITAIGAGFVIGEGDDAVQVASLEDFSRLIGDVANVNVLTAVIAQDVANVNTLTSVLAQDIVNLAQLTAQLTTDVQNLRDALQTVLNDLA